MGAQRPPAATTSSAGEAVAQEESLEAVTGHWEAQFALAAAGLARQENWLSRAASLARDVSGIARERVAAALESPKRPAPGPDGVTYAALDKIGEPATDVLWGTAQALMERQAALARLNSALMVLIPKGEAEGDDESSGAACRLRRARGPSCSATATPKPCRIGSTTRYAPSQSMCEEPSSADLCAGGASTTTSCRCKLRWSSSPTAPTTRSRGATS